MTRGAASIYERIERSRLLSDGDLADVRGAIAKQEGLSDETAVNRVVESGLLTAWQGLQLLAGRNCFFIGPYKLLQSVGHGGAAAVYKAEHATLGRIVALKVFAETWLRSPQAAARFRRETQATVRVNHPHVVRGYGSKVFEGRGVLIMEYVAGDDLARWLKRCGPPPIEWCCEAARQAALGLAHIHQRDLVHRDLKPSNILAVGGSTRETPHVKVADLGAANIKYDTDLSPRTQITVMGAMLGTPNYMAPEQIENGHAADHRSDIFSLGCTLFKLLTNELPWRGTTLEERLIARMKEPPIPLRQFRREATPRLEQMVEAMLSRQVENRPASADEVARVLAEYARSKGSRPPAAVAAVPGEQAPPSATPVVLPIRQHPPIDAPPSPLRPVPVEAPPQWRLLRESVQGPPEIFMMRADETIVLGRGRDCQIRLRDVQASRRHCQFSCRDGHWWVEDLGSQNGTHVNGNNLNACLLQSGDQVRVGSTRFWILSISAIDSTIGAVASSAPQISGPATA